MWHDGTVRRDLVHVEDIASAFAAALAHPDALAGRHWLLGAGRGDALGDVFRLIAGITSEHTGAPPVEVTSVQALARPRDRLPQRDHRLLGVPGRHRLAPGDPAGGRDPPNRHRTGSKGSHMTTRVWDYLAEYRHERLDILAAVEKVFDSGQLVLGESVRGFEEEFAAYHGLPHCVGVDNGTNAITLGLRRWASGRVTR